MTLKKVFTGLISLAAALIAVCAISVSAGAERIGDYSYIVLEDGTVEITVYSGDAAKLTIPSTLGGKKVTSIGEGVFHDCDFTSVTLPNSLTSIGDYAFYECSRLTSIVIPEGVTSIKFCSFSECSSLKSITIPKSVTSIGNSAFTGCSSLASVTVHDGISNIGALAFDNTPFYEKQTSTVKYLGNWVIGCNKNAATATIKSGTVGIACGAFEDCISLTSIKIPNGVKSIGFNAFFNCSKLTSVTLPDSVTNIGFYAFGDCSRLASINIPDSVESLDDSVFDNTALLNNQTGTVKYVENWLIHCDENANTVKIKNGTVGIADGAFAFCADLSSIIIPDGLKSIGSQAFTHCSKLASVTIPDSVKIIGKYAFSGCSKLASIVVDKDNKYYLSQDGVLFNKKMTEIIRCSVVKKGSYVIPNSVTSIDDHAFEECSYLTSITLPTGVTSIGENAFSCCSSLTSINIPDGVTSIGDSAFQNCSSLTSITIPDGMKTLRYNVFYRCLSLTSITIPTSVTNIRDCAFEYCSNLNDVYYIGSKSQWSKIYIDLDNIELFNANMHYLDLGISGLKLKGRTADALRIAWNKDTSADGYIIERKDGAKWTRIAKITKNSTTEYRIEKLKAGTAYTFRVKAYKMSGKTAFYSGYTTISARTNPSAISGLKLKARAADALRLTWTKNTSADGYIIEMKSGSTWTRVGKITKNSTVEFKKSKLKAGTAYTFRVKAYKMSGKTALYSGYKSISVRTNPSVVSGLKLKNSAKDAVRLSWNKNTSADGYIIEMKSGTKWVRAGKISKNSTVEFKKSGLKSKTSYTFRVKAYKMSGKTALYGAAKTITVKTK